MIPRIFASVFLALVAAQPQTLAQHTPVEVQTLWQFDAGG